MDSRQWTANGRRVVRGTALAAALLLIVLVVAVSGLAAATDPGSKLYGVDASSSDVKLVLEALARRSGLNIVVSPEVTGEVTAHLKQMPIEAILDHICIAQGFAWRKTDDAYIVAPKEKLEPPKPTEPAPPPPEPETLVWTCRHAKPSDLTSLITKLFPALKVAEGPNAVTPVLEKTESGMDEGTSSSTDAGVSAARSTSTTIVLIGDPAQIASAKEVLTKLDVARPQISIQVAITEVNDSANRELGIDWTWSDLVVKEAAPDPGISFGKLTRQAMTFTGVISALIKDGGANLLAQPNISVVDGECADILIGERILFPKLVGYTQFGTPIYDKEEERVGIYLQIAPKVAGDGQIVMTLYPQVSLVTSYLKTQAGNYPQISTREAKTTVRVKDGTTIAIGGLLREDEIKEAARIPLLGDIPIIGQLFRHTKKTRQRTEIVIFLTPQIQQEQE